MEGQLGVSILWVFVGEWQNSPTFPKFPLIRWHLEGQESPPAVKTLLTQPRNPCPLSGDSGLFPLTDIPVSGTGVLAGRLGWWQGTFLGCH